MKNKTAHNVLISATKSVCYLALSVSTEYDYILQFELLFMVMCFSYLYFFFLNGAFHCQ